MIHSESAILSNSTAWNGRVITGTNGAALLDVTNAKLRTVEVAKAKSFYSDPGLVLSAQAKYYPILSLMSFSGIKRNEITNCEELLNFSEKILVTDSREINLVSTFLAQEGRPLARIHQSCDSSIFFNKSLQGNLVQFFTNSCNDLCFALMNSQRLIIGPRKKLIESPSGQGLSNCSFSLSIDTGHFRYSHIQGND